MSEAPAERHRRVAGVFTDRVLGTADWGAPSPVAGWTARDVVRHLTDWFPAFLAAGCDVRLARGPGADADPVATWRTHSDAVQALLDDPATSDGAFAHPYVGAMPLGHAVDQFYTSDVFMHTWDLARATGQDDRLDPQFCAALLAGMEQMEEVIRSSGQFGARVPVAPDADPQTRLLGFIGRDPVWKPE
jgi:uncharacterized protein (TIGR03086 family)